MRAYLFGSRAARRVRIVTDAALDVAPSRMRLVFTHREGIEHRATLSLVAGFVVMMLLDAALAG